MAYIAERSIVGRKKFYLLTLVGILFTAVLTVESKATGLTMPGMMAPGMNPMIGMDPMIGMNPMVGMDPMIGMNPMLGMDPMIGMNPMLGMDPMLGFNPMMDMNPMMGMDPMFGMDPFLGAQMMGGMTGGVPGGFGGGFGPMYTTGQSSIYQPQMISNMNFPHQAFPGTFQGGPFQGSFPGQFGQPMLGNQASPFGNSPRLFSVPGVAGPAR